MAYNAATMKKRGYSTSNIHSGFHTEFPIGAVTPPIYATSTFVFPSAKAGAKRFALKEKGMIYSRIGNPTVEVLEKKLAALEHTDDAVCFASGMNAITTLFWHFLQSGDEVVAHTSLYGGTYEFLRFMAPKFGIKTTFVNFTDLQNLRNALSTKTKIIYFETPTNPLLEIIDIREVSKIAKKHKILSVIDNTFAPPFIQYPLDLGIDISIHSLTKYINGHADIIGGTIIATQKLIDEIRFKTAIFLGGTMSPFTAYLVQRGMATLNERLRAQSASALKIAMFLEKHAKVEKVFYPGLVHHSKHNLAKKQMHDCYGAVIAFILKGGIPNGVKFIEKVEIIKLAVSLGGVESLVEHPASMTHSEYTKEDREKAGIYDGLIRLSVGLENTEDLIQDITHALK